MSIITFFTRKLSRSIILSGLGLLACTNVNSQDIHFSQFLEDPLDLNPALCGAFPGLIMGELNYRNQWSSVMNGLGAAYNTMAASFQYHNITKNWSKGYVSPGLNFFNDKSGDAQLQISQVNFTIASGIFLSEKSCISAGIQAGWAEHSINMANLTWDNQYVGGQYVPGASSGEAAGSSFSYFDFAAGILYHYGSGQATMTSNNQVKADIGAAVFHINEPQMSFYQGDAFLGITNFYTTNGPNNQNGMATRLYMKYVIHGDVSYSIPNSNIAVVPTVAFFDQGPAQELDMGANFRYLLKLESKYTGVNKGSAFDLGGYYRWNDAFIVLAGLEFGSYAIGFSYDVNLSALNQASNGRGGFEISLRFINPNPFMGSTESGGSTTHTMF